MKKLIAAILMTAATGLTSAQDITIDLTNPNEPDVSFAGEHKPKAGVDYRRLKFKCSTPLGFNRVELTNDSDDLGGNTTIAFGTDARTIANDDAHDVEGNKLVKGDRTVELTDESFKVLVRITANSIPVVWPPTAKPAAEAKEKPSAGTRLKHEWLGQASGAFIPDKTTDKYQEWLASPTVGSVGPRPWWVNIDMSQSSPVLSYRRIKKDGRLQTRHTPPHPVVGSQLPFIVTNYHPRTQRITLETEFKVFNQELQSRFEALWDPTSVATGAADTNSDEESDVEKQAALMCQLMVDLQSLTNDLQAIAAAGQLNNRLGLRQIQDFVALRIMTKLDFDPDAEKGFIERGEQIASGMKKEDQDEFGRIVAKAELLYRGIVNIGDQTLLSLNIKEADAAIVKWKYYELPSTAVKAQDEIAIYASGGFKIDFSAGLAYTTLIDDEFEAVFDRTDVVRDSTFNAGDTTITVTNTARYRIDQKSGTDFNIGAAIMAHAYYRSGAYINPAISVGFLVNNNTPAQYLIGGSLAIGHEARLVLTAGTAFGKVKRLKTGLHPGGDIDSGATTVPTEDEWHNNFFFGVGLNFAKVNVPTKPAGGSTAP